MQHAGGAVWVCAVWHAWEADQQEAPVQVVVDRDQEKVLGKDVHALRCTSHERGLIGRDFVGIHADVAACMRQGR